MFNIGWWNQMWLSFSGPLSGTQASTCLYGYKQLSQQWTAMGPPDCISPKKILSVGICCLTESVISIKNWCINGVKHRPHYNLLITEHMRAWLLGTQNPHDIKWSSFWENRSSGLPTQTRLCSHRRWLWLKEVEELHFPCSENKVADHLCGYANNWSASLFSQMQKSGFLRTRLSEKYSFNLLFVFNSDW